VAKWLGRQSYLDDLNSLDNELYKGLISASCCSHVISTGLLTMTRAVLKNYAKPEELALNFTVTEEEFGLAKSIDLVPGGSEIGVTADNRHECSSNARPLLGDGADSAVDIQLVCKYKLDKQIAQQSRAFFNGLSDIIDPKCKRSESRHDQAEFRLTASQGSVCLTNTSCSN
jgi:ubiquitin-protein ligase E3 C